MIMDIGDYAQMENWQQIRNISLIHRLLEKDRIMPIRKGGSVKIANGQVLREQCQFQNQSIGVMAEYIM